ncbi:MAG: Gfo/Idh/MocA family protein [Candidatus Hodarchaeota archaeon]
MTPDSAKPLKKVRMGLYGAGGRGTGVARNLIEDPRCECTWICDTNEIRLEMARKDFESRHGITVKATANYKEMLADPDLDLILVATPDFMHHEHALQVCKAGKHLFLEKPIGINLKQCHEILTAAREADIIFETGYVLRYTPFFSAIKELVSKGELGRINFVEAEEAYYGAIHFFKGWQRYRKNVGAIMIQKITHDFDLFYWMFGEPKRVFTMGSNREYVPENNPKGSKAKNCRECPPDQRCKYYSPSPEKGMYSIETAAIDEKLPWLGPENFRLDDCIYNTNKDITDHTTTVVEFRNGLHAVLNMNYFPSMLRSNRFWHVYGSDAEMDANGNENLITIMPRHSGNPADVQAIMPSGTIEGGHGGGDYVQAVAFLDALTDPAGPREARAGILSSYWSSVMVMAASESLFTGQPVDTDEFRKDFPVP